MRRQGLNGFLFLVIALMFSQFINDKLAFVIGVIVALSNLLVSRGYAWLYQRRVSRRVGQSLTGVVSSWLTRLMLVCGVLSFTLISTSLNAFGILAGFVLGQIYFISYQLIGLKEYGK